MLQTKTGIKKGLQRKTEYSLEDPGCSSPLPASDMMMLGINQFLSPRLSLDDQRMVQQSLQQHSLHSPCLSFSPSLPSKHSKPNSSRRLSGNIITGGRQERCKGRQHQSRSSVAHETCSEGRGRSLSCCTSLIVTVKTGRWTFKSNSQINRSASLI